MQQTTALTILNIVQVNVCPCVHTCARVYVCVDIVYVCVHARVRCKSTRIRALMHIRVTGRALLLCMLSLRIARWIAFAELRNRGACVTWPLAQS